jgi:hypothetical protein
MFKDPGGPRPKHRVYALLAGGQVVYIGVAKAGRPSWEVTWVNRERLDNAQARLFRGLAEKPTEVTLLGSLGIHADVAYKVAETLGAWFRGALVEKPRRGGYPPGRPVCRIGPGGRVQVYPSRTAAAKAAGVNRKTMIGWLRRGGDWIDGTVCEQ